MSDSQETIFLIGARGTGKSTIGRMLADQLQRSFTDLDEALETTTGREIREIFATDGEDSFRDLETEALDAAIRHGHEVIATGGGAVLRTENRQRMKSAGRVVWLQGTVDVLISRLAIDPLNAQRRPSLSGDNLSPAAEMEQVLKIREPLYRELADLEIYTDGKSPEEITHRILEWLVTVSRHTEQE